MPVIASESQTLITGVYRTGSEYVVQLLDSHPRLSATMYRVNVLRFACGRFDPIHEEGMRRAALDEIDSRLSARYGMKLCREDIEAELCRREHVGYGDLYDVVMSSLYLTAEVSHWAEKCQLAWREIPDFLEMMPNGRAIVVLRDPRSVLASFKHYTYAPAPAYLGAIFNCLDAMQRSLTMVDSLPAEKFMVVRYEDAAIDPLGTANRVFRFLHLSELGALSDSKTRRDAYGREWIANSAFHDQNDPNFDVDAAINRWKGVLSPAEVALTEAVCGSAMKEWAYEPSGLNVDWKEMVRLFIHDDAVTSYFRLWVTRGEGIQAFPTDPRDPRNWGKD